MIIFLKKMTSVRPYAPFSRSLSLDIVELGLTLGLCLKSRISTIS